MIDASESPYLDCPLSELASAVAADALRRRPALVDPVVTALGWQARQYMVGACTLLAAHLHQGMGFPVVILEGRPPGQSWMLRHAAVLPGHGGDAPDLDTPVLDAAGGGTLRDRMGLFDEPGWECRVVRGKDPDCGVPRFWEPVPGMARVDIGDEVACLPALCHELGLPFGLRAALAEILADPSSRMRPGASGVLSGGLAEWATGGPSPIP